MDSLRPEGCLTCKNNLAYGQKCSTCGGSRATLEESCLILEQAIPHIFDTVRSRFVALGISETAYTELASLGAINSTLGYWSGRFYEHNKGIVLADLSQGKLPSQVYHELSNSIAPNLKIMDGRYQNAYHKERNSSHK